MAWYIFLKKMLIEVLIERESWGLIKDNMMDLM